MSPAQDLPQSTGYQKLAQQTWLPRLSAFASWQLADSRWPWLGRWLGDPKKTSRINHRYASWSYFNILPYNLPVIKISCLACWGTQLALLKLQRKSKFSSSSYIYCFSSNLWSILGTPGSTHKNVRSMQNNVRSTQNNLRSTVCLRFVYGPARNQPISKNKIMIIEIPSKILNFLLSHWSTCGPKLTQMRPKTNPNAPQKNPWGAREFHVRNMICLWFVYDLPMVCLWFVYGLSMVCLWFAYDFVYILSMICLWFVYGLSMVCLWFVYGLSMVSSFLFHMHGLSTVCLLFFYGFMAMVI